MLLESRLNRQGLRSLDIGGGDCVSILKNIRYDMLSFLLQTDLLSQCLFEGLY